MKRLAVLSFLIVVFMLFSVSGCSLFGGDQSTPDKAAEAFMEALKEQDSEKLAELTGEDPGEMIFDVEEKIDSYEIESVESLGDTQAAAKVIFKFKDDDSADDDDYFEVRYSLDLTKSEDNKWYITGLDFEFDWNLLDIQRTLDAEEDAEEDIEDIEDFDWDDFDDIDIDDLFPEEEEGELE